MGADRTVVAQRLRHADCDGPKGSSSRCICHDGMFPELARGKPPTKAATSTSASRALLSTRVNDQWIWTNKTNAWHNLMYAISVNLAGYDGVFYFGEGTVCNYDSNVIQQGHRNPWEIVTAELFPRLADKARENWALENNIFDPSGCRAVRLANRAEKKANYLTWVRDSREQIWKNCRGTTRSRFVMVGNTIEGGEAQAHAEIIIGPKVLLFGESLPVRAPFCRL